MVPDQRPPVPPVFMTTEEYENWQFEEALKSEKDPYERFRLRQHRNIDKIVEKFRL